MTIHRVPDAGKSILAGAVEVAMIVLFAMAGATFHVFVLFIYQLERVGEWCKQ